MQLCCQRVLCKGGFVMLYTKQSKKVSILCVLEVLKKYSDENHRLNQKEIAELIRKEFGVEVERKTIKRDLMKLIEMDYDIGYDEMERQIKDQHSGEWESGSVYTNFYFKHVFEDGELRLITDSIISSKHIPDHQRKDLINKVEQLSSKYWHGMHNNVVNINIATSQNQAFFLNLEMIDEAIRDKKQIMFTYNEYKIDAKLHPVYSDLLETPKKVVVLDGHYYVECAMSDSTSNMYRVDKITDLDIIDSDTDLSQVQSPQLYFKDEEDTFVLLNSNKDLRVQFSVVRDAVELVVDHFGQAFRVVEEQKGRYYIEVRCNAADAYHWALQNGKYVSIIKPAELRNEVRATLERLIRSYSIKSRDKLEKALFDYNVNKRLNLMYVDLRDLSVLSDVTEPTEARFQANHIYDYSFVGQYKSLRSLRMIGTVCDFTFLTELEGLQYLRLKDTGFQDLRLLKNCKELKRLCLLEKDLENFEVLYELPKLEFLHIDYSVKQYLDLEKLKRHSPQIQTIILDKQLFEI